MQATEEARVSGALLKSARLRQGMSQTAFADLLSIAQPTLSAYESGHRQPTVPTRLERELACNPFLRADDPALQARWGGGDATATFAALRAAKDSF